MITEPDVLSIKPGRFKLSASRSMPVNQKFIMELEQYYIEKDSQFNMNCTTFTTEDFKFLNRLRNITAIVCAVITLAILVFLIYQKACSSLFQRLYLYLVIGTLLAEVAVGLSIEHQWHYRHQKTVCVWIGLFSQWTWVFVFVLSYEIIIHLLCMVAIKMKDSPTPQYWIVKSKYYAITLEIVYIALPVLISTGFAIFPYVKKSYGIAGPWCWIHSLNECCEPSGFATQMAFYGLYVSVGIVGMAASLVFVIVYFKLSKESRHHLKKALYVIIFQFIHILLIMYNLSVRIYTFISQRQLYGLWSAHAFIIPIGILVFPLGYLICFHSVNKAVLVVYKRIINACPKQSVSVTPEAGVPDLTKYATVPKSDRTSQPSYTYFVASHPDASTETSPLVGE